MRLEHPRSLGAAGNPAINPPLIPRDNCTIMKVNFNSTIRTAWKILTFQESDKKPVGRESHFRQEYVEDRSPFPHNTESESYSVMPNSLRLHGLQPAKLLCLWNFPEKNTGVGSHSLLQGIFPTQGSNPGFPYCRQILYHLSHQGSPRILEWVAYPFSRESSWPRNRTGVSCIAGRFFTSWATHDTGSH